MKRPAHWLGPTAQSRATSTFAYKSAPVVLWGCAASLAAGDEPELTLAEVEMLGRRVGVCCGHRDADRYANAMKTRDNWSADNDDAEEGNIDELEAWAAPRSSITKISLDFATARRISDHSETGRSWTWRASTGSRCATRTRSPCRCSGNTATRRTK